MYWGGVLSAGMTAFYIWRAMFLTFFGEYRGQAHPHESPLFMTLPLSVLALLSLGGGFLNVPAFLEPVIPAPKEIEEASLMWISAAVGLVGIGLAYLFYMARPGLADEMANRFRGLYTA